jgi:ABC-type proline/glycine betaine transport system permease subunit
MLLGLTQSLYWLATIVALTMIVTAAALAFAVDKTDGLELYAVAGLMVVAAVGIWTGGRAIYRLAQ